MITTYFEGTTLPTEEKAEVTAIAASNTKARNILVKLLASALLLKFTEPRYLAKRSRVQLSKSGTNR